MANDENNKMDNDSEVEEQIFAKSCYCSIPSICFTVFIILLLVIIGLGYYIFG